MTAAPGQPTGWIKLTLQGCVTTSSMVPPKALLNDYPVHTSYGENLLPVPPGDWRVEVSCQWLREFGEASLDCRGAEGGTVPVCYAAPLHQFTTGTIGQEKQNRKGLAGKLGPLAVIVVIGFLVGLAL